MSPTSEPQLVFCPHPCITLLHKPFRQCHLGNRELRIADSSDCCWQAWCLGTNGTASSPPQHLPRSLLPGKPVSLSLHNPVGLPHTLDAQLVP